MAPAPVPAGPRKLALLVPLTGPNAALGQALEHAASLALTGNAALALDVRDTAGDPQRAAAAARDAAAQGDPLILGPLTAAETTAAAAAAGGVPMLAFTSDASAGGPAVWPLGVTAQQQMRRLAQALRQDNRPRLAAVLPPGALGDALAQASEEAAADAGLAPPQIVRSTGGADGFDSAVRDLAQVDARHGAVEDRLRALRAGAGDAAEAAAEPAAPAPFDALLIAETGPTLAAVLPKLPGYEITMPGVRLLGPAFFASQGQANARLRGAWYAAPDPAPQRVFADAYTQKFGAAPPPLAGFAFDAAAIAAVLAREGEISPAALTRAEGFAGAGGLVRLMPDGTVRRALAVMEVSPGGDHVVLPAPDDAAGL